jgi:hypothetical protein
VPLPHRIMEYLRAPTADPPRYGEIARPALCRRCGGQILSGMDDCPIGSQADADPVPLESGTAEALARLAGLATYRLRGSMPQTLTLQWRGAHDIAAQPVGSPPDSSGPVVVVPQHRCPSSWRPAHPGLVSSPHQG